MIHRIVTGLIGLCLSASSETVSAHHSFPAVYDTEARITLEGVVREVWYENPHARLYVAVPGDDGNDVVWEFEASGATQLRRQGWRYSSIEVGDRVIVEGSPAREHANRAFIRVLMLGDGAIFWAADPATLREEPVFTNPEIEQRLSAGVWRSLVTGGTNLYDFPLTLAGQERFEGFRLDQDPALRCEPPGMPRAFYHLSPMDFRFEANTLTIRYETMDVVRTVAMNGALAPAGTPHTPNGYSVGHWEGDSLIIDTTHLAAGETTRDGFPKSDQMTLREAIRVEDRDDGSYLIESVTITDPENFREPFTSANEFVLESDWELLPFDCNPTEYFQ